MKQGRAIIMSNVREVRGDEFRENPSVQKQVSMYFAKIAESRNRARQLKTEIEQLKKKSKPSSTNFLKCGKRSSPPSRLAYR
jgi:seryl-tRNA synthetase